MIKAWKSRGVDHLEILHLGKEPKEAVLELFIHGGLDLLADVAHEAVPASHGQHLLAICKSVSEHCRA